MNIRFIRLKAKVTCIDDLNVVGTYPDHKTKRNIHVVDHTGHIQLVLWRDRAENVQFSVGNVLGLQNVVVSNYGHTLNLSTTFVTGMKKFVEDMMVPAAAKRPLPKSNVVSLESPILAIEEFSCSFSWIDYRNKVGFDAYNANVVIKCPACSSMFLKVN